MPIPQKTVTKLRADATAKVRSGFYTREAIISSLVELAQYYSRRARADEARSLATTLVAEAWAAQLARQASWPEGERTSYERLAAAFEAMNSGEVLAKMNWTCCATCGGEEIREEREIALEKGQGEGGWLGYVFFHEQSTEAVVGGDTKLPLYFSSFDEVQEKDEEVGRRIVRCLEAEGLEVEWDGDTRIGIVVKIPEWRRRIPEGEEGNSC
ncbi:uncharacterized protein BJX67DRAFT_379064 [Aspergillus lucknowensis]|uniref:DUF6891 domain-containing protein n=1 Tax=Aspergillus lucknowensis TaxID=176173 RepID=A0ABR4LY92_9EURO